MGKLSSCSAKFPILMISSGRVFLKMLRKSPKIVHNVVNWGPMGAIHHPPLLDSYHTSCRGTKKLSSFDPRLVWPEPWFSDRTSWTHGKIDTSSNFGKALGMSVVRSQNCSWITKKTSHCWKRASTSLHSLNDELSWANDQNILSCSSEGQSKPRWTCSHNMFSLGFSFTIHGQS